MLNNILLGVLTSPKAWPAHDSDSSRAIFHIFGTTVHWYGVTMACGFIIAITISYIMWVRKGLNSSILDWFILLTIPVSIIGARFWWCLSNLTNPDFDHHHLSNWINLSNGGLAIEGGVLASVIAASGYFHYWRHQIDWHVAIDIILPNVLLGQIMGRWGNFLNGEVFGHVTSYESLKWLPEFIRSGMYLSTDDGITAYRQPLFLYEGIINFFGYLFIYIGLRQIKRVQPKLIPTGVIGSLYFIWYGTIRAILEPFRNESDIMRWGSVSTTEIMSAIWIILGVVLIAFIYFKNYRNKDLKIVSDPKKQ